MSPLVAKAEAARFALTLGALFERAFTLLRFLGFAEAVFLTAMIFFNSFFNAEINAPFVLSRL